MVERVDLLDSDIIYGVAVAAVLGIERVAVRTASGIGFVIELDSTAGTEDKCGVSGVGRIDIQMDAHNRVAARLDRRQRGIVVARGVNRFAAEVKPLVVADSHIRQHCDWHRFDGERERVVNRVAETIFCAERVAVVISVVTYTVAPGVPNVRQLARAEGDIRRYRLRGTHFDF